MIALALLATTLASTPLNTPRYAVMHVNIVTSGVRGTGTIAVDRTTGRFARRFDAGPASESEGFDGRQLWRADATGMSRVQGNAGERRAIMDWSAAFVAALSHGTRHATVKAATDKADVTFARFERKDGLFVPRDIESKSLQNGAWSATLRSASTSSALPASAFEPPAPPHDFSLRAATRVAISTATGLPVLPVRVDGTTFHFILDTGGQNVITTTAAARAGLHTVGGGKVSGGGGGIAGIRYAFADTVSAGSAQMRHQPFIVLTPQALSLPGVDGIVGYELLARFAARLDLKNRTLELAPRADAFAPFVRPVHFAYFDRQPQIDGALDGIPGPFSIDTGSMLTAAVQQPFVDANHLIARLDATVATYAGDVGGRYPIYLVRAREMRLGHVSVANPLLDLMTAKSPTNNATIVANVGEGILRRWIMVFDYAGQRIDLRPGGDLSGSDIKDRSGIVLRTDKNAVVVVLVLKGTPAAAAGIQEGARLSAVDGRPATAAGIADIRSLLQGKPGTPVTLSFADGTTKTLTLRRYL